MAAIALEISPALILSEYIINTLGLMTNPTASGLWPLYTSYLPDSDDVESNAGAIIGKEGFLDGRLMKTGEVINHPGLQLKIRSLTNEIGYVKIESIGLGLDQVAGNNIIIDGSTFEILNIKKVTDIISLGLEEGTNRKYISTIDFLMTLKKIA